MKKVILVLFFVTIFIRFPKSFALLKEDVIIANPGHDYSSLINKDGYYPISNNINWNNEGRYKVNYVSDYGMLNKNIILASNETLNDGQFYNFNCLNINLEANYHLEKTHIINENDFLLMGYVTVDDPLFLYQDGKTHPYLQYYYNEELVWEKIFTEMVGKWVDFCLSPNGIILLGEKISLSEGYNIILYEMNFDGQLLRKQELHGSGQDHPNRIFMMDDYLYIVGETSSNDKDYSFNISSNSKILFIYMQYGDFSKFSINVFGNNGYNFIIDSTILGDELYTLIKLGGNEGYFEGERKTYNNFAILRIDQYLDLINYYIFNESGSLEGIVSYDDKIVAIKNKITEKNSKIVFYRFDKTLSLEEEKDFVYPKTEKFIYDLDIKYNHKMIWIMGNHGSFGGYSLMGFSNDCDIICINRLEESDFLSFLVEGEYIYIYGIENNNYFLDWCFFINRDEKTKTIKINNYSLTSDPIDEINDIDYHVFGQYDQHIHHSLGNYNVYNKETLVIESYMNIRSNEKYDIGVVLEFNGIGYLNDFMINSGYCVNEEGKYLLELIGVNDRKIINFNVQNLSIDLISYSNEEVEITPIINNQLSSNTPQIFYNNPVELSEKPNNIIFTIISIILCGGLGGWIIPNKKREN